MTGQGSERPNKGKGVARRKKRQRQAPKYVLRVPANLPTIAAPGTSSVGPPPTPTIQPPTPAVDPTPTSTIHRYPTPAVHPSPTLAAHPSTTPTTDPLPPPVIITLTPPPVVITPTPLPDPTSIPSSSCTPPSETVTPSADPDSSGDGEGLEPSLHDRPWIEPYGLLPSDGRAPEKMTIEVVPARFGLLEDSDAAEMETKL
ncbi:endoglucanase A-like [Vigna umbellata]|uniref:endoglucanase A-like n=1 Tax=Vigna umbellata TaxID=87088 RepID=UPI001F5EDFB2|nr:endoglucanase A-like [Vigna umbellata]